MKRLDQFLVLKGLAPSRTKAKELIEKGVIEIAGPNGWRAVTSASFTLSEETEVRVTESSLLRYVSRAGLKLEGALKDFSFSPQGLYVFDVGQSTGGFTDCLLQQGAKEVLGIDVGHGQLALKLAQDPRVKAYEGVHISELSLRSEILEWLQSHLDLCVIDVSFISVVKVFEALQTLKLSPYDVIALIKPQFEVGREALSKSGVVKSEKTVQQALALVKERIEELGFVVSDVKPSVLPGADGNQEYFFKVRRTFW